MRWPMYYTATIKLDINVKVPRSKVTTEGLKYTAQDRQ